MKKLIKLLLAGMSLFSIVLTGCSHSSNAGDGQPAAETDKTSEIYQLYNESGGTATYEEWLKSIRGADGSSVLTGATNPSFSIGSNGDTYINTTTWDVFLKTNGNWVKEGSIMGTQGPKGNQGEPGQQGVPGQNGIDGKDGVDGKDGTSLLTGNGAPNSALGKESDSYIDLDTWDYYVKTSNGWTKQGNIKGNDGKDGEPGKDGTTYIPAIFNNYDGSMLYTFYYEKGSTVFYDGPTPTRPSDWNEDEELPYTFIGWDKSLENIQEPTIYTAQYRGKMYTVTFQNYDGAVLYMTEVERGHDANYVGDVPIRNDNPNLEWSFTGWDKPLTNITANTIFVAQFYAPNSIKCVFQNYDGTVLSTQYVGNGDTVVYQGNTPIKQDEDDGNGTILRYTFTGWDKSLKNLNSDTVFTAQFGQNTYYRVKFVDYDESLLYETTIFHSGKVTYLGKEPNRELDVDGDKITKYTFAGWDGSLDNICAPKTLKAQYNANTFTGYKVTFLDDDQTELFSDYFSIGSTAIYPYKMNQKYDNNNVSTFIGWDKSLKNITGPLTVTACYMTITRAQNGEYPRTVVTNSTLISQLNAIKSTNERGYYEYNGEEYASRTTGDSTWYYYYNFSDGSSTQKNKKYYFKVEPIKWQLLEFSDNSYTFIAEEVIDKYAYSSGSNNYSLSGIRKWLNGEFYNVAFKDDSLIETSIVDNSTSTTSSSSNTYCCEITYDKLYLLSYKDYTSPKYGFNNASARICDNTDYTMAKWSPQSAYYYTRSPSNTSSSKVWGVYSGGGGMVENPVFSNYINNESRAGVRPAIKFRLSNVD